MVFDSHAFIDLPEMCARNFVCISEIDRIERIFGVELGRKKEIERERKRKSEREKKRRIKNDSCSMNVVCMFIAEESNKLFAAFNVIEINKKKPKEKSERSNENVEYGKNYFSIQYCCGNIYSFLVCSS